jgi:cytochrome oxidase Cu insertion factor (SCO1/SenC/PrrC family)
MHLKITRALFSFVALFALAALPSGYTDGHSVAVAQRKPAAKKKAEAAVYTCPMHADVKSSKPGRCPKCGMDLRLAEKETPDEHEGHTPADEPANEPSATKETAPKGTTTIAPNTLKIPDTVVYNQHGQKLNFYTDLVRGKTVAINFVFTTCTTICPPLTATFRKVQQELGDRVGRDIELISVSVDPTTDVPQRLKEFSAKFKAAPGWTFVTGGKPEIDRLLSALGAATADKNDHTPMLLIGNDAAGYWTRTYGLAPAAALVKVINEAASKKSGEASRSDAAMPQPGANAPEAAKTPGRLY